MSPQPLAAVAPYIHPGSTVVYWVETVADTAAPTREELDAGRDLSRAVAAVVGWVVSRRLRTTQTFGHDFETQLPYSATVDNSVIVFRADETGGDISKLLSDGDDGYVVMLYGGDVEGNPMDVWPVRVAALGRGIANDGSLAMIAVQFAITDDPALGVAVPAEGS